MASHATKEVRREQILAAAQECFGKHGYHKTKIDDIVRAAGLSKGAIYWHFKSKDEIFLGLFDQFDREIFSAWDDVPGDDALETLRLESEIVLDALLQDRALIETWTEFMKHPAARQRFAAIYNHSRARLGQTIQAGIDRGQIAACDPQHAAAMLTALIEGLLLQAMVDPDYDPRAAWPTAWQIVKRGMLADQS